MPKFPVVYPPGPRKKRYTVESYDAWEAPPRDGEQLQWLKHGEFDDPTEAVACANRLVRTALEALHRQNPKADAEGLRMAFWSFADVPCVFGEPKTGFNLRAALDWHIRQLTRGAAAAA